MILILLAREAVRPILLLLLVAALAMTFWETRERKMDLMHTLWWLSVVLLTHVLGYLGLRVWGVLDDRKAEK